MKLNLVEQVYYLRLRVNGLLHRIELFKFDCQEKIDKQIESNNRSKTKPGFDECLQQLEQAYAPKQSFMDEIRSELLGAIALGEKRKIPMTSCKSLCVQLEFDRVTHEFITGVQVELSDLERLVASSKPSRVQPDHPITKWYRQHGHKYENKKIAVEAYVEIHSGNYIKLYNDLRNDLKKNPLSKKKNETKSE